METSTIVLKYKDLERDYKIYSFEFSPVLTAGDIVDRLNKLDIESVVSFEDDGDCGMKSGGEVRGRNFRYSPDSRPWGGYTFRIIFKLEGKEVCINAYQNEDGSAHNRFSVGGYDYDINKVIDLFGWYLDERAGESLV